MEYIGIHKISGLKIYKHEGKHYLFEEKSDAYIHMQELSEEQKNMIRALHSDKATILFQR
jgi:hypothetical protein